MKRLFLMRHAKSSWKNPSPDYKRGLKKRGKNDAKLVANELKNLSMIPDIIISSFAKRAEMTADIVVSELADIRKIPLMREENLYETGLKEYLTVIENIDDRYDSAMIVAHNPTISDTAVALTGDSSLDWLPTSAVAILQCDIDSWSSLREGRCQVIHYITAKYLKSCK